MPPLKDTFRNILESLNLLNYAKLRERVFRLAIINFISVLLIASLVSGLIYIPRVISFSNSVKESLNEFEKFSLNPEIETSGPISIWSDDFLVFDTESNVSANDSRFYVDSDFLYYNNGDNRRELSRFSNIVENSDFLGRMIVISAFILLPSFLFGYFVISFLLLSLIVISAIGLVWLLTRLSNKKAKKAKLRDISISCLYASTILGIALILNSLNFNIGIYLLIVFLIYSYLGSIQKTRRPDVEKDKGHKKKKVIDHE